MTPRDWSTRLGAAVAAVLFFALLISLFRVEQVPALVPIGLLALAALAAVRPDIALLVLAASVPIATWLGRHVNGSVSWPETLAVAFGAGYLLRAVKGRSSDRDALDAPVLVAATLVIAALLVQVFIDIWRFGGPATRAALWELTVSKYFVTAGSFDPVDAAMRLLESLLLFRAAATLCREQSGYAQRLISWIVVGASMAAALNLLRVSEGAQRADAALAAFVHILMTSRVNVHYGDLNAAGSYFVMMFFVAIGLVFRKISRGLGWLLPVILIGSSVWITGSRTAVMAGMLAMVLPAGVRAWRLRHGGLRRTTIAVAVLMIGLLSAVAAFSIPERGNQQSAVSAAFVRWELAKTSFRMTAASPSFGVGIGRFYARSGEFSSPELLRSFPPAIHENAHNNFLQLLAELGIVGFTVTMWLLVTAARLCARLLRADLHDPLRWSAITGLLAFVLSWLGGHPLLIDEPAFSFWLLLGTVAGWGAASAPLPSNRTAQWTAAVLGVLILISIPVRVDHQKADFNLEHRGVGVSGWHDAVDDVRYRLAGSSSSIFVPSDASTIAVPLRAVKSAREISVELLFDGRPADVVTITADRWHILRLRLPQEKDAPRFRRLDLRVAGANAGTNDLLMIGKVEPR